MSDISVDNLFEKLESCELPIQEHFESQGVERFKGKTLESLSVKELQDFLNVLEELDKKVSFGGHLNYFEEGTKYGIDKLPKHKAFFEAGSTYRIRAALAANRVGKSVLTSYEAACHATGIYPPWWMGKRFNRPVRIWVVGLDWGQIVDSIQSKLYGARGNPGTGMIAKDNIVDKSAGGVPGSLSSLVVKHVSGKNSVISFKTNEQEITSFQGAEVDVVVFDEEPHDYIFDECAKRLVTTNGIMLMSFTPQKGLTPFLSKFYAMADLLHGAESIPDYIILEEKRKMEVYDNGEKVYKTPEKLAAIFQWSIFDVPWISEEQRNFMISTTLPHQMGARIYGRPSIGDGAIFPFDIESLTVEPFEIPKHYRRTYGLDVGWVHPTAVVWVAVDPDTDIAYVYSEHSAQAIEPVIHAHAIKQRGDWIIGNIDYSANSSSQLNGEKIRQHYVQAGLKLVNADKSVEPGLYEMYERFSTGRLKIFKNCSKLLSEIPLYHRDDKGKIVKQNDDLIDACRYAIMGLKYAKAVPVQRYGGGAAPTYKKYDF